MRLKITPGLLREVDMLKPFRILSCTNAKNEQFLNNRDSMKSDRFETCCDNMADNILFVLSYIVRFIVELEGWRHL